MLIYLLLVPMYSIVSWCLNSSSLIKSIGLYAGMYVFVKGGEGEFAEKFKNFTSGKISLFTDGPLKEKKIIIPVQRPESMQEI